MADYSELRRLHAEIDTGLWPFKIRALLNALPGLLDEVERGRRAEEVLRVAGDYDEAMAQADRLDAQAERIAQLEAALRELIEGGSMDEKDMLLAYAALEGKKPK